MEYIDIFDENNNPIGRIKEKQQAHEEGDFHRTAHIWIMNDKNELLLQKRSASKKSHPNCWDTSGAGHIKAGESVIDGAIRELKEELGVEAKKEDLEYITIVKSTKDPKNKEYQYIYLLHTNKKINEYVFEDAEVSKVKYVYYKDLEKMVEQKVEGLLIHEEEYKFLFEFIRKNRGDSMKDLSNKLKTNINITIKEQEYIVKTKTWYSVEEDETVSYIKCELSNDKVLVIIPDDELIYIGKIIEDMKYERISEDKIKYNNRIFSKTGEGHQFIKNIEFGNENEVEGECTFEDYEEGNNIISLGILTDKENKRADVYADILKVEDIVID